MVGPEETASSLAPEREVLCAGEVPAEDDWRDGHAREGAAHGVRRGAGRWSAWRVGAEFALEFRGVGLPEGEGLPGELKVAAEGAVPWLAARTLPT